MDYQTGTLTLFQWEKVPRKPKATRVPRYHAICKFKICDTDRLAQEHIVQTMVTGLNSGDLTLADLPARDINSQKRWQACRQLLERKQLMCDLSF